MNDGQNMADEIKQIDVAVKSATPPALTVQQQLWIDYNALGGLITDITDEQPNRETGKLTTMRKMPILEFANLIDVSRETLRQWRSSIPDFWAKVDARRRELGAQSRLQRVHETWYLRAVGGSWPHMEAYLRNFDPGYKDAAFKAGEGLGSGLADLVQAIRKGKVNRAIPVEGEVVNAPPGKPQELQG